MRKLNLICTLLLLMAAFVTYAQPEAGMPSVPGKCYAKCLIQDQYETVTEQVLVKDATTRVEVVPAQYENVTEQVLSKEGASTLSVVPAQFETMTEQVLTSEGKSSA